MANYLAPEGSAIWQDRELRFDSPMKLLLPRTGEKVIDSINAVEDTKGNNGERGAFSVTNLRIIWCSHANPNINLSIGFDCVVSMSIRSASSRLRGGNVQALHVMTKFNNSRFEFIFTSLVKNSPRLFTTIQAVSRAYETTRVYRDVKLRTAIIRDGSLLLLPHETVIATIPRVSNASTASPTLGTLHLTSIRLVWHAASNDAFNLSVPHTRIARVYHFNNNSAASNALLVVQTRAAPGEPAGHKLGFFPDTDRALPALVEQIGKVFLLYAARPELGIDTVIDDRRAVADPSSVAAKRVEDDLRVLAPGEAESAVAGGAGGGSGGGGGFDALAAFYADGPIDLDREPEYNADLGLAVERMREGMEIADLWQVTSG